MMELIKKIREQTGAGIADVKAALDEAGGDEQKAIEVLRKAGQKIAARKVGRATKEGLIGSYVHTSGKIGALVSVACETDFVARNADFQNFVHELCLQVAAYGPLYLCPEQIPAEIIEHEKEIYLEQLAKEGKTGEIAGKIIEGKLNKFYEEVCLLRQRYVKDDSITIERLLQDLIAKIGENIQIKQFARLSL